MSDKKYKLSIKHFNRKFTEEIKWGFGNHLSEKLMNELNSNIWRELREQFMWPLCDQFKEEFKEQLSKQLAGEIL